MKKSARQHSRLNRLARAASVLALVIFSGCSSTLETGYEPRRLGASDAVRRGYYATPFTPEARAASQDREQEYDARRPRPGM
jgi:hypothetical protein